MKLSEKKILSDVEVQSLISNNDYASAADYLFYSQLNSWELMKKNYEALKNVQTKSFWFDGFKLKAQYNPERIKSTSAEVNEIAVKNRECFLCIKNLPEEQKEIILVNDFLLLCNPYPIFPQHFAAGRSRARVVVANVPFPLADGQQLVDAVLGSVTARTRLLLIDHVTSPTGLVLPIAALVRELRARGVETLVDAAHAPGMLPLNVAAIGAAWYTGNCHKWICGPKGAAFLYTRPDMQQQTRPAVISHGASWTRTGRSRYLVEFD